MQAQEKKVCQLNEEIEFLDKDNALEEDKLTTQLLKMVAQERKYAVVVLDLLKVKQEFYFSAHEAIIKAIPKVDSILENTSMRPIFGEDILDHLKVTKRKVAFPIALAVNFLLDSLSDEGIFRISTHQVKLDKVKAHMDARLPYIALLQDNCDCHFFAALLKSYLRELPYSLMSFSDPEIYDLYVIIPGLDAQEAKAHIKVILDKLPEDIVANIHYIVKFLSELAKKSDENKMTVGNLAIAIGPSLLWRPKAQETAAEGHQQTAITQEGIECVIKV